MRRPNRGVLCMDIALSISYNPVNRSTNALLVGLSDRQAAYVRYQLGILASLTSHPLLLPTLICAYLRTYIEHCTENLWDRLLKMEIESGYTGVPLYDQHGVIPMGQCDDFETLTKGVLGVIQLSTSFENHAKCLLLTIESIKESILHLNSGTQTPKNLAIEDMAQTLLERLRFLPHRSNMIQCRLQFIIQRTQTQMTAIYNHIAQRDSQLNRELVNDSREIASASKRDSSAMKAIAVLTMAFLPSTLLTTVFAMPLFDWPASPGSPVVSDRFWIFCAVAFPLTFVTLMIWIAWLVYTTRQNNDTDRRARESVSQTLSSTSLARAIMTGPVVHIESKKHN